jgi:hypothetical protein
MSGGRSVLPLVKRSQVKRSDDGVISGVVLAQRLRLVAVPQSARVCEKFKGDWEDYEVSAPGQSKDIFGALSTLTDS